MKKLFLLATIAMLSGSVAFANGEGKDKSKRTKPVQKKPVRSLVPKNVPSHVLPAATIANA